MTNNKGMALVIVLWIAVILSSITIAGSYLARLEIRQSYYPAKELQLISASMSAIEKVKVELAKDDNFYTSLKGNWATAFKEDLTIGDVAVKISVKDEESKFNLNTINHERLEKLSAFDKALNKNEIIDSLIDWQDADSNALPDGAEDSYYKFLDPPKQCKNKPLDCIEEVSQIKGFSDSKIIELLKKTATVNSDGKININTAPVETLMTLPKIDYLLAQAIIAHRNGKDLEQGTEDDLPYDNIQRVEEVVGKDVYKSIQNLISIKSLYFKVTVKTSLGKYSKIIEALLCKQGRNIQIKYWKEN